MPDVRTCPNCHRAISGHPNKKFCNTRCKDKYWNRENPRGQYAFLRDRDPDDEVHPHSDEAHGQWTD